MRWLFEDVLVGLYGAAEAEGGAESLSAGINSLQLFPKDPSRTLSAAYNAPLPCTHTAAVQRLRKQNSGILARHSN